MRLPDVPEYLDRDLVTGLIRDLGFDPNQVLSLQLHCNGVLAEVFAIDAATGKRMEGVALELARHRIWIPIRG